MSDIGVQLGVYEHFKGGHYLVLGVAEDSRDGESLVVYIRLYGAEGNPMGARPLREFVGLVETPDGTLKRFRYIGGTE